MLFRFLDTHAKIGFKMFFKDFKKLLALFYKILTMVKKRYIAHPHNLQSLIAQKLLRLFVKHRNRPLGIGRDDGMCGVIKNRLQKLLVGMEFVVGFIENRYKFFEPYVDDYQKRPPKGKKETRKYLRAPSRTPR